MTRSVRSRLYSDKRLSGKIPGYFSTATLRNGLEHHLSKWRIRIPALRKSILVLYSDLSNHCRQFRCTLTGALANRSLVSDILILQIASALVVSLLAVGGLWWTSTSVIENNLEKWGEQWINELDNLGIPLFISADQDRYLRIESYIRNFSEIKSVRYYARNGEVLFEDNKLESAYSFSPLSSDVLSELAARDDVRAPLLIEKNDHDDSLVRLSKPLWVESFESDGLLDLDMSNDENVSRDLVGFVEIMLDFSSYQTLLNRNIVTGSLLSVLVLLILAITSGLLLRRALQPLARLQNPLAQLAMGRTNFNVESSGHKEITAIADALNTTVSALKERDDKLWQAANYDPLTGLLNRFRFSEELVRIIEEKRTDGPQGALLFIDLDQFKYVNDTLGHAAGDNVLKQAAARIQAAVRKVDLVSRFGGDEFVIFVRYVTKDQVRSISESLVQDMCDHPFIEKGHSFRISCSIGVAMVGRGKFSPAELLAKADIASHEAKARGRNRIEFYQSTGTEMRQMAVDAGWSGKIRKALKDEMFTLRFQPIAEIASGEISHYEVLLRLRGDNKRLVAPDVFLPAANRFGMMTEIDRWVIRTALRKLSEFRRDGNDINFTLNISGNIFDDEDLFEYIRTNLEKNDVPAEALVLEITEQVAVRSMINASEQMKQIVGLGCRFAIDDFGAGYSSYSYLKSLPVNFVKIDGVFIRSLAADKVDQKIVGSICEIAQATGKQIIAEYVEDAEIFDLVAQLGAHYAQGYFVGRPAKKLKKGAVRTASGRRVASKKAS